MSSTSRRQGIAAGALILAMGLSVRFPITSVSPLLSDIGEHYGLGQSGLAALSSIPVLLFGLASPLAPWLVARLGLERALTVLLATLAFATLVRPLNAPLLFGGTVIIGATIALIGILAPQVIRRSLPKRGGFWTGVYTTAFGASAAAGAAFAVPVFTLVNEHTAIALASWAIPLLIALGVTLGFVPALKGEGPERPGTIQAPAGSVFKARGLWPVTGFFACQALIYFSLTAWLPTIAADRGMDPVQAGLLLAWMSIAGLPASLLAPTLAGRVNLRTALIVTVGLLSATGLFGLAYGPLSLAPVMVAVLGIAQSAAFGLSIALIVFTAPSAAQTASFSAVSQGVGYLIAASGPLLLGLFAQLGWSWANIVALLTVASLGVLVCGVMASRASLKPEATADPDQ